MILSCPSCGARFRIDADSLGPNGRTVRCSKCKHTWQATPEMEPLDLSSEPAEGSPKELAEEAPTREVADELAEFRAARRRAMQESDLFDEPARRRRGPVLGWLLFFLVVAALLAGGWFGRDHIVAAVPQAADVYAMVGVPVSAPASGLELRDVTRSQRLVDGEARLVIEGRVVNSARTEREVPAIKATLYDADGNELATWTFAVEESLLEPGGAASFSTERVDPPENAREVSLTFNGPGQ